MPVVKIVSGQPHPLGWVPTSLKDGDELGSFPGHSVDPARDLSNLYDMTPQAIVEANGVQFTSDAINAWVLRTGGITLDDGQPVLAKTSVIFLPPGGPRSAASSSAAAIAAGGGGGSFFWWGIGALALGGGIWWLHHKSERDAPRTRKNPDETEEEGD